MKTLIFTLAIGIQALSASASSGPSNGGGGDSIARPQGGRTLLDLQESDELKFFTFDMQNYSLPIDNTYRELILGCLVPSATHDMGYLGDTCAEGPADNSYGSSIDLYPSGPTDRNGLSFYFKTALAACNGSARAKAQVSVWSLDFPTLRWAFTKTPLEEISDEGAIKVTNPETKKQVAIQSGNLVVINEGEFNSMDSEGKAALKLHESTLCAIKVMNPRLLRDQGTAPIRYFVRTFANYAQTSNLKEGTPVQAIADAAKNLLGNFQEVNVGAFSEKNVQCQFSMWKGPRASPQVLASCKRFVPETSAFIGVWAVLELSADAQVLRTITDNQFEDGREVVRFAQKIVKNNLKAFMKKWNEL